VKYKIQHHNDRNIITIHLDLDLLRFLPKPSQKRFVDSYTDFLDEESRDPNFLKRLLLMKGVVDVVYNRHSLDIYKGELFSWRKMIPAILEDLETVLNGGDPAVRVCRRSTRAQKKMAVVAD
jgi:hypothetical protein